MVKRHLVREHLRRKRPVRDYMRGQGSRVYPYSGTYSGNPHISGKLTEAQRDRLPDSAFAVINPGAATERERRKYPIYNRPHARNALARVSRFGDTREK